MEALLQGATVPENLVILFWFVLIVYWLFSAVTAKKYANRNYASWLIRIAIIAIVFAMYSTPAIRNTLVGTQNAIPLSLQWVGVVLCACGVAFAIWARVYLGRNWGMPMSLKQDAELITSGPYEYVRHPIYSGFMLAAIGTCLVTIWWIVPLVLMAAYFVFAARAEEKIMAAEFGQTYSDYMKRSKMLIPFVF